LPRRSGERESANAGGHVAHVEWNNGPYSVTSDPQRLDVDAVHAYLTRSFWARGISKELVARSIERSLCFSLFHGKAQVGLARVVSDFATYAYLCDVYVLEAHQRKGLGKWMVGAVMSHPDLQGLRRFQLMTRDAHGLYTRFGFKVSTHPERLMEIFRPGMYSAEQSEDGF
jgi:GNAT superfamily N-acetyltransferase